MLDPSSRFLGIFQPGALQHKSKVDSKPVTSKFDIHVDNVAVYECAITAIQLAGEVGAKYTSLTVSRKSDGKLLVIARNTVQSGNKTTPWPMFTCEVNGESGVDESFTGQSGHGATATASSDDSVSEMEGKVFFGVATKLGGDSQGNFKKNKKPRTEYKVGDQTMAVGSTTFVKDYYFHSTFRSPSDESGGAVAIFTYLQKNVKDEKGDWNATVWRSMRCAKGVDALGLFVAGLALEQQWYWGFAMDEDPSW